MDEKDMVTPDLEKIEEPPVEYDPEGEQEWNPNESDRDVEEVEK